MKTPTHQPFGVPFDLNKLCNFGFDVLKEAIEYLAKQQAEMDERLKDIESKEPVTTTVVEKG